MAQSYEDFYLRLRTQIDSWLREKGPGNAHAGIVLFAPDLFHLLLKLSLDPRIPRAQKLKLGAAIAYFVSPVDLVPEALLGPAGYVDDIALAAYVLNGLVNAGHGEIAREHWAGSEDLLDVLQRVLAVADRMLGSGMWRRVKAVVGKR